MSFQFPLSKGFSYGYRPGQRESHIQWIGQNGEMWEDEHTVHPALRFSFGSRGRQTSNPLLPIGGGRFFRPVSDWSRGGVNITYVHGEVNYLGWGETYNPLTGQLETRRDRRIFRGTAFGSNYYGEHYMPDFIDPVDGALYGVPSSNMRTRVLTELMLKVGSRKTNYGESIGEARQTINHLAKTVKTVASAYMAARKGNWSGVAYALGLGRRQVAKGNSPWASRWMEYQYAWLPLLGDIHDSAELLKKGFRENTFLMSSVRNIKEQCPPQRKAKGFEFAPPSGNGQLSYKGKLFYSVNESSLARMHQVGLINPLEVAWALMPYSFVVDWFLPVGNFLEALTAPVGVNFIDGYLSTTFEGSYSTHNRPALQVGPGWWHEPSGEFRIDSEFHAYKREKLYSFPTPGLYYKSPFSTTHVVSAVAMLRQLLR